jgi:hypothetical protein
MKPSAADERRARAEARAAWPVRTFALGNEPHENLSKSTTAAERLAMMWPLARSAWLLAHGEIPSYPRGEMPCRAIQRVRRRDSAS